MAITPIGGNDENSEIFAEINITPLTDIFLVLLIIFMITSSAMIESGGKINLPKAVATQSESRGTTVTLTPKHEIFVNQKLVSEQGFEKALQDALTTSPDKTVILRGDKDVLLGEAVNRVDHQARGSIGDRHRRGSRTKVSLGVGPFYKQTFSEVVLLSAGVVVAAVLSCLPDCARPRVGFQPGSVPDDLPPT